MRTGGRARWPAAMASVLGAWALGCGPDPDWADYDGAPPPDLDQTEQAACADQDVAVQSSRGTSLTRPAGARLAGFGAQYNDKLYAPVGGVDAAEVPALLPRLAQLKARHVRVFFAPSALGDPVVRESFSRVVAQADAVGATINVTYQGGPFGGTPGTATFGTRMPAFADVLHDELVVKGRSGLQYVTVGNEVNSTALSPADSVRLYQALDAALRARGIRDRVKLVAGDLLRGRAGTESDYQAWIRAIAPPLQDVIDGYSLHIYWQFFNSGSTDDSGFGSGITLLQNASRFFFETLEPGLRKPVFITEFGARGYAQVDASGEAVGGWPGFLQKGCQRAGSGCSPFETTIESALHTAWFNLEASRLGFTATVKWDAYWAHYDKGYDKAWSAIGPPASGWARRPSYYALQLFTHGVDPGWRAVGLGSTSAPSPDLKLAAFSGPAADDHAVFALNKGRCPANVRVGGLTPGASYRVLSFNQSPAHAGKICLQRAVAVGADGALSVRVAPRSLTLLTRRAPRVPNVPGCD